MRSHALAALVLLPLLATPGLSQTQPLPKSTPPGPPGTARPGEQVVEEIVAWINDDIVLWTELRNEEQQQVAQLLNEARRTPPEQLSKQVQEVREKMLVDLISQRLIVQEAERLYDINEIKRDVLKRWKERQKIKTDEELDQQLAQWGMTRPELEERLVQGAAPDIVIDMQVGRNLSVSDQEARAWYEKNRDKLSTPTQVTFREIVLLAQDPAVRASRADEARRLAERARGGTDFVELVRSSSEAPSKALDGRIGPIQPSDLLPAIGSALTDLATGQVSEPIETGQGWHILKVEERREGTTASFEQARPEVEAAIRDAKFGPALETYLMGLWDDATIEVRRGYVDRLPARWREHVAVRD